MNIIQITDLHLCQNKQNAYLHADSAKALKDTVDYILNCGLQIEMVIISGDLSDDGSLSAYEAVREQMNRLPCPVYCVPGNHDDQNNMIRAGLLPDDRNEITCRKIDMPEADILLFDSTNPARANGLINGEKMRLLDQMLGTKHEKPKILFMHHVPFTTGYGVMDLPFEGLGLLTNLVKERNDLYICCGHIHAAITTRLGQAVVITCPPVCMEMEFDLSACGGDTFYCREPQFALHRVSKTGIITHFCTVPTREPRRGAFSFLI